MAFVCLPTKHLKALKNSFSTECSAFRITELASFEISWHFTELRDTRVTAGEKPHIEKSRTSNNWPKEPLKLHVYGGHSPLFISYQQAIIKHREILKESYKESPEPA